MTDKAFNLLDECPVRCVCLFPQEEEYTSSCWGESKMYTSENNETNESGTISKTRNWVESDIVKH